MSFKAFKAFLPLVVFVFCVAVSAQTLSVREIMREPSMAGMRPDSERLSPNGKYVIFAWNPTGEEPRNLYIVGADGANPRVLVDAAANFEQRMLPPESKLNYGLTVRDDFVKAREKNLGGVDISPDSQRILFSQNSDIYVLDVTVADAKPRRITRTQGFEAGARWLTNDSILFSTNGNYFVLNIKDTALVQVTREANPAAFVSIFNVVPTKDARAIAYVVSDGSKQRALFVPNYLDDFVTAPTTRRGFSDQKIYVTPTDGSRERPYEVNLPKPEGAGYIRGVKWAADNTSLIVDRIDQDLKRRQLFFVNMAGGKAEKIVLVTEERDEKWVAGLSRLVEPNPNNPSQIVFGSERDGYNHLYLATLETARPTAAAGNGDSVVQSGPQGYTGKVETKQLTKGAFEVDFAKWTAGDRLVYSSTEASTAEREFYQLIPSSGTIASLAGGLKGMKIAAQTADPGGETTRILYEYSAWDKPTELVAETICNVKCERTAPVRLTSSAPAAFAAMKWNAPKFVDIPARDGKPIKSKIYVPADFDAKKKYPMVIFVHGAGYLQNTINGWNNYYREFMFNQMLTQKGYVVLDIDYRGSAGYGRDWRTDVYDFLGGKDYEDHLDAIDYMVKNYAVDAKRVGAYGGSYGGFMAEMLAFRTDKIASAAALRPVADWKNYFASSPVYTVERLGFPEKNVEGYKRSSPIAYADGLNKPLLILHGLVDDNVHAQDSMQLIEKLMRLEKTRYFDAMIYPAENHGFARATSWADEYERIFAFFEKTLKN